MNTAAVTVAIAKMIATAMTTTSVALMQQNVRRVSPTANAER
jgi:hypothetical protein